MVYFIADKTLMLPKAQVIWLAKHNIEDEY